MVILLEWILLLVNMKKNFEVIDGYLKKYGIPGKVINMTVDKEGKNIVVIAEDLSKNKNVFVVDSNYDITQVIPDYEKES